MAVVEAIEAWRDFYGAVANATAALLGLVFVGMSLHLTLRRAPIRIRSLALASAITLIQPLLVSFVMLIPTGAPTVHATGSIIIAGVLALELGVVLQVHGRSHAEATRWLVYRFGLPLGASALLAGGAVGMLLGWPSAVWAPALFVFVTVIVGVQDAWDLLISPDRRHDADAEVPLQRKGRALATSDAPRGSSRGIASVRRRASPRLDRHERRVGVPVADDQSIHP